VHVGCKHTTSNNEPNNAIVFPTLKCTNRTQSYNDLISSESNRELSQIQEEITKATQSSMGQVSVVGQKEHVSTENPLGGIGSLDGIGSFGSQDYGGNGGLPKGAIDSNSIGPQGNSESFPGSDAANQALENALQASAQADMNGESMPSQQQQQQQQVGEAQTTSEGDPGGSQQQSQEMSPIDVGNGYQDQNKQMMGAINVGSNQYEGSQSNQMENNQMMQQMGGSNNYMSSEGQQ